MGDEPAVYDHYRRIESGDAGAVFRVVGVDKDLRSLSASQTQSGDVDEDPRSSSANQTQSGDVDEAQVTILRLTDGDGNREATGDLRDVSRERLDREFTPTSDPGPRFELPDYVAGLLLLGGVALAIHPAGDRLGGVVLAVGGAYLLWRRR